MHDVMLTFALIGNAFMTLSCCLGIRFEEDLLRRSAVHSTRCIGHCGSVQGHSTISSWIADQCFECALSPQTKFYSMDGTAVSASCLAATGGDVAREMNDRSVLQACGAAQSCHQRAS